LWAEKRPERASKQEHSTRNQRNTDCQRSKNSLTGAEGRLPVSFSTAC